MYCFWCARRGNRGDEGLQCWPRVKTMCMPSLLCAASGIAANPWRREMKQVNVKIFRAAIFLGAVHSSPGSTDHGPRSNLRWPSLHARQPTARKACINAIAHRYTAKATVALEMLQRWRERVQVLQVLPERRPLREPVCTPSSRAVRRSGSSRLMFAPTYTAADCRTGHVGIGHAPCARRSTHSCATALGGVGIGTWSGQ